MKPISQVIIAAAVAAGLTLGAAATGTAQGKAPVTPVRHTPMSHPSNSARSAPKATKSETFPSGVATVSPAEVLSVHETYYDQLGKLRREGLL